MGKPTFAMKSSISSILVSSAQRGWSIPNESNMAENLWRFSARSMEMGEVPRIGTF